LNSFENEVLQSQNFNQQLPIKSNKTFLLEWWNIFFYLYTEKLMGEFRDKNTTCFAPGMVNQTTMNDLFKNEHNNVNLNMMNQLNYNNMISLEKKPLFELRIF